ncbi:MAG: 3-hydroxyacyl-CoA dehydrogenase NAD-binding domain-containing protein, partial [Lysobacterales bacterium]
MTNFAEYNIIANIAVITLKSPPVNGLGHGMRTALLSHYRQASTDDTVEAILIASGIPVFCGGADINEFAAGNFGQKPELPELLNSIEASEKPVVAAINGAALGGGLELALACDYRFAHPQVKLGLPEVHLGLLPGAGGTQRLPRLIDPLSAADMIVRGTVIGAERATELGLVDEVFSGYGDFFGAALNYTSKLVAHNAPVKSFANVSIDAAKIDMTQFDELRKSIARSSRGFHAPECCIQAVEAACTSSFKDGMKKESELFAACSETPQARAQQHIFFAERAAGKIPGVDKNTQSRKIEKVAFIGAGTMGGGIAMNFANAGIPATLLEVEQAALERGLGLIRKNYEISAGKGKLTEQQVEQRMDLLHGSLSYEDIADADLVIEAVFENMEIKQQVFRKLDEVCKPGAVLATNTSTLNVDEIAAVTSRPEDVIGLHFFSPANVMRLLEIVRGAKTAGDVIVTAINMGKSIRKVPVVAGVCWGFIGNRLLEPYGRESCRLILEGATPAQIDRALTGFGMAMGYTSMIDMAGIDVGYLTRAGNKEAFAHDPAYAGICDKLYSLGRFGQKTGRGFYIYHGRDRLDDPEVVEFARQLAAEHGIQRREISDQEIIERTIYMLINEGARTLEDGIAYRAGDIDLVYV